MRVEITGGVPDPARMAALAAGIDLLVRTGASHDTDLRPAAYRSRWRRAALLENTEVPAGIKDNGAPWGGMA